MARGQFPQRVTLSWLRKIFPTLVTLGLRVNLIADFRLTSVAFAYRPEEGFE